MVLKKIFILIITVLILKGEDELTFLKFIEAVINGHQEAVMVVISSGDIDINRGVKLQGLEGMTALMIASSENHINIIKDLIYAGTRIDLTDKDNRTALMYASIGGKKEAVKVLVKAGAKVNIKDNYGMTPLMYVAKNRSSETKDIVEIVEFLIENEADINAKNIDKKSSFMLAAEGGNLEVIKVLIENGADINLVDKDYKSTLMLASEEGNNEIVKFLLEKNASINSQDKFGNTALLLATKPKNVETINLLLKNGANPNVSNDFGLTPLIRASQIGDFDIVYSLLEYMAEINAKEFKTLQTPLIIASDKNYAKIVSYFLKGDLDVNTKDKEGESALIKAIKRGYLNIVEILVNDKRVDLNDKNAKGITPLILALLKASEQKKLINLENDINKKAIFTRKEESYKNIAKLLIKKGADTNIKSNESWSAMQIAIDNKYNDIARLIMDKYQKKSKREEMLKN